MCVKQVISTFLIYIDLFAKVDDKPDVRRQCQFRTLFHNFYLILSLCDFRISEFGMLLLWELANTYTAHTSSGRNGELSICEMHDPVRDRFVWKKTFALFDSLTGISVEQIIKSLWTQLPNMPTGRSSSLVVAQFH